MNLKPLNPEYFDFNEAEPLGLQVLAVRGQARLWQIWQDEAIVIEKARRKQEAIPEQFFGDPFLLKDMQKAVDTLGPIIDAGGRILIHGDYDCDGITATTILYRFFKRLGVEVDYYIPERLNEGYGLSEGGVARALSTVPDALITVDCGVQSFKEVESLEAAGIAVVVTDHHVCLEKLPSAHAVINPNRRDEGTEYQMLAGAGVALKLCQALNRSNAEQGLWMEGLQFAALGTVADLMSLEGENRRIVSAGLAQISNGGAAGLAAMLAQANISAEQLRAKNLSYSIAPRINASGRMGSVEPAMLLMLSDEPEFCQLQAQKLEEINQERRQIEGRIFAEALLFFHNHPQSLQSNILLAYGEQWHAGVLGIVAARLVKYFQRPVIVLTRDNGLGYKGSARSIGSIDILSYIQKCSPYLTHFGGHSAAAGLELPGSELDSFQNALAELSQDLDLSLLDESQGYTLKFSDLNLDLPMLDSLDVLEPFGKGNEEPFFLFEKAVVGDARAVGKDNTHLRISLQASNSSNSVNGIGFGLAYHLPGLAPGLEVNVLAKLQRNQYRAWETVDLLIQDLSAAGERSSASAVDLADEIMRLQDHFPTWTAGMLSAPFALDKEVLTPQAESLKEVYLNLLAAGIETAPLILDRSALDQLCTAESVKDSRLRAFVVRACLDIYEEAGLLTRLEWGHEGMSAGFLRCYNLQKSSHKVNLYDTKSYRRLSS